MGCVVSKSRRVAISSSIGDDNSILFKELPVVLNAEQIYGISTVEDINEEKEIVTNVTCKENLLAVRVLLDDQIGCQYFNEYLDTINSSCIYYLWYNIEEYKLYKNNQLMYVKACHIYDQFFENTELLTSKMLKESEYKYISSICAVNIHRNATNDIESNKYDPKLFDIISDRCLSLLCDYYIGFVLSPYYSYMNEKINSKYNRVKTNDFEYLSVLGRGGYGLVVHCVKKSTGVHYAMKIQPKNSLRKMYDSEPWRVCAEKNTFACCKHPYIVELSYAFHTPKLAMMVMTLGTCGSLGDYLTKYGVLTNELVCFYAAELVSVLLYLHDRGLIYRDLKPTNILLQSDGHIQLVDFGSVADVHGHIDRICNDKDPISPFISKDTRDELLSEHSAFSQSCDDNYESWGEADRVDSIVGTACYMAPEMFSLCINNVRSYSNRYSYGTSYSYQIDWWSLGATMYRLLTAKHIISKDLASMFLKTPTQELYVMIVAELKSVDYTILQSHAPLMSILNGFLQIDPEKRLGNGVSGATDIMNHCYFNGVNWNDVQQKSCIPPYYPIKTVNVPVPDRLTSPDGSQRSSSSSLSTSRKLLSMVTPILKSKKHDLESLIVSAGRKQWLESDINIDTTSNYNANTNNNIGNTNIDFVLGLGDSDKMQSKSNCYVSEFEEYFKKWNYISNEVLEQECFIQNSNIHGINGDTNTHSRSLTRSFTKQSY